MAAAPVAQVANLRHGLAVPFYIDSPAAPRARPVPGRFSVSLRLETVR